jgi:hypothetical protein
MRSKQTTAVQQLIKMFKENIYFLESSLQEQPYVETRITIKARISQARYSLRCAEKMLEEEEQQIVNAFCNAYLIGEDDISSESAKREAIEYIKHTYEK